MWLVALVAIIGASVYVIGGREFLRRFLQVRTNANAALQPPTQAELQRAPADTAQSQTDSDVSHVTIGVMALWIAGIIVVFVALFFWTGRRPRKLR